MKKKIRKILLGTSTDLFFPQNAIEDGKFKIYFYGHLIPLQGQEYILEAACLLEKHDDIVFLMGGSVAKKKYDDGSFKNVIFKENVFKEKLAEDIQGSDVCLGIFGDTIKSKRVIPNKIYDYVACRKPVITADTPAIRELFDENDLYLVPTANSEALAKAILKLKEDSDLREKLAENSYNKFTQNCTPKILGKELLKIISF
ncbi:MAG: glycosyltransferase [Patescibacteria group bacterium]